MFRTIPIIFSLLIASLFVSACASNSAKMPQYTATGASSRSGQLTPYRSPEPSASATAADPSTATPQPSATPTPLTHTVLKGEDLSGIALRYGVSLEELKTANPTVNPHFMSIGTVLVIPASRTPTPAGAAADNNSGEMPTPTAIPLEGSRASCTRAQDGGIWCFQLLRNTQDFPLEGIAAVFHLLDKSGQTALNQTAFLPLDTLPPGAALPLSVYIPPARLAALPTPLPETIQVNSEIQSALPNPRDGRYLRSAIENKKVFLSPDGLSADVSLDVGVTEEDSQGKRIWVAAVAYDAKGNVAGVRRWEHISDPPLKTGQAMPVKMHVYSVAGEIDRIECIAEIRP